MKQVQIINKEDKTFQEKMMDREKALGYVNSSKVILGIAENSGGAFVKSA